MKHKLFKRTFSILLAALLLFSCFGVGAAAASKKSLAKCSVSTVSSAAFNGKAQKPAVTVKYGKTVLKNGKHYTLTYKNNKSIGTASVRVTAKKNSGYTGTKTVKFKIVPGKVKNLSAAKTAANSVKLTWSAVKGATGYAVYSYNKTTKAYTKVKNAAKAAVTVKNLSAATNYSFAVRAYTKVNGKNYWGAYSAVLAVKTAAASAAGKANRFDKYQKIFESGTYQITFTTNDSELGKDPITFATKKGNVMIDTKIQSMKVKMLYLAKEKKTYMLMDALRIYTELPADLLGDEGLDFGSMVSGFAVSTGERKASTVKVNGKSYNCESSTAADGTVTRYLFNGDTLVQIDTVNPDGTVNSTYISKLTGAVPDSTFQIPKNYKYMSMDWLMSMAG